MDALLELASDGLNFYHAFSVVLYKVLFMSVASINRVNYVAIVGHLWVLVMDMCVGVVFCKNGWISVLVRREHFCERIAHFYLTIKGLVEESLVRI